MNTSLLKVMAILAGLSSLFAPSAQAADRGQSVSFDYDKQGLIEKTETQLPENWQKHVFKGAVLDYQWYRLGEVIYRDPVSGVVSLKLGGKVVRVMADSRKVVDIFTPV